MNGIIVIIIIVVIIIILFMAVKNIKILKFEELPEIDQIRIKKQDENKKSKYYYVIPEKQNDLISGLDLTDHQFNRANLPVTTRKYQYQDDLRYYQQIKQITSSWSNNITIKNVNIVLIQETDFEIKFNVLIHLVQRNKNYYFKVVFLEIKDNDDDIFKKAPSHGEMKLLFIKKISYSMYQQLEKKYANYSDTFMEFKDQLDYVKSRDRIHQLEQEAIRKNDNFNAI